MAAIGAASFGDNKMTTERIIDRLHNNPPEIEQIITDGLKLNYEDELALFESNLRRETELPPAIENDDDAGRYSDYLKKLASTEKSLDAIRKSEKEEYSSKANIVHAFFKKKIDQLTEVKNRVSVPHAEYLKKKADEKRRADEEKARAAAEEAAQKLREAQERERIAQEAQRLAEQERAKIEAEAAQARAVAEAAAAAARAEAERESARVRAEIEARAAAEEMGKRELQAQLKAAEDAKKQAEAAAKEIERAAREAQKESEEKIKELNKEVRELNRESNRALDEAVRSDKSASKLEKAANASLADLSRTRGDSSMASVSEHWVGSVINRDQLDLEALREHLPFDALERATQAFVNAGGRTLRGAIITQELKTAVR